jgi:hypothetical protein
LGGARITFANDKYEYFTKNIWYENKNEMDNFPKDLGCNLSMHYAVSLSVW